MMYINKTIALFGVALVLIAGGCSKKFLESDLERSIKQNEEEIVAYLQEKNLNYTKSPQGIHYEITQKNPTGQTVEIGDQIRMYYNITLLNNNLVDSLLSGDPFTLGYYDGYPLIGLLNSVSLLKTGEKGTFLIPANLMFGSQPSQNVPAWSVLKVDIEVLSFRNEEEQIQAYVDKKGFTDVSVSSTGLRFIPKTIVSGGSALANGDQVVLKYKGTFLNDTAFDEGEFTVTLGANSVIPGFEEGIKMMRVGEQATVVFPSKIGYGTTGSGAIPPYSPLLFELTILSKR